MKIVFLGATQFSRELFLHLLNNQIKPERLFTIPQEFSISYSDVKVKNYNFSNLAEVASEHRIPCYEVESTTGKRITDYYDDLVSLQPDVILVMGWYYMVPKKSGILQSMEHGVSMLPYYQSMQAVLH